MGAKSVVLPGTAPSASAAAGRGGARARWAAGTVLVAAVLTFCYLRIAGDTQVNSDGAAMVWQAQGVLHGNVLLHGWWAADVSFYTTELPEYVAVTAVAGLRPEVVHICSALTYTMLVLLAAFVARGRARGAAGLARALLAAGVILAPQPTGPTLVTLGNPDHVGTGVPVLVLLLLLDRARPRWWVPVAAGALLAWSIIGDPLVEVVGSLPLFVGCGLRAIGVARSWRPPGADAVAGRPRLPGRRAWAAAWYELSLTAAAAASVPLALAGNRLITALGGYSMASLWTHLQSRWEIVHGLPIVAKSVLVLFDADFLDVAGAGNVASALVHLAGVAVVLAAFAVAAWGLLRRYAWSALPRPGAAGGAAAPGDLVADFIVIAIVANFAAFVLEVPMQDAYMAHEIGPLLALGAALAGRVLGDRVAAARAPAGGAGAGQAAPAGRALAGRRALAATFAVVLACYAVTLGAAAAHRQAAPRNVDLAAWLLRHHLTSGLSPYWEASSVTVDTGGAVTVVSVTDTGPRKRVAPQHWETYVQLAEQYKSRSANFVILSPAEGVYRGNVVAAFGEPARSYTFEHFTIMVWPVNLLPLLAVADRPRAAGAVSAARPGGAAAPAAAGR